MYIPGEIFDNVGKAYPDVGFGGMYVNFGHHFFQVRKSLLLLSTYVLLLSKTGRGRERVHTHSKL